LAPSSFTFTYVTNNGQVVHFTHVLLSPNSIIWKANDGPGRKYSQLISCALNVCIKTLSRMEVTSPVVTGVMYWLLFDCYILMIILFLVM